MWGEYAVLAGAPAAVAAVDRYATVQLTPAEQGWHFTSAGFLTPGVDNFSGRFSGAPGAEIAETVLRFFGLSALPASFNLVSDTSGFYHQATASAARPGKFGIGSSAALSNATYCALADFLGREKNVHDAIAVHKALQDGKGSGLDIAASWYGGCVRFQNGSAASLQWPEQLHWQAVWTGSSAATGAALGHFAQWQAEGDTTSLDALVSASEVLCEAPSMDNLSTYIQALRQLDESAKLNIFTPGHQRLATIAAHNGLAYKPCGAGGGDIGIAVGEDPQALQQFCTQAAAQEFVPLNLEIAPHGVRTA